MGWFLTSGSSGKARRGGSKRGSRKSSVDPKPWDPTRTLLALRLCAYVALAVGVVVGWVYLEESLTRYASARHAEPIMPDAVVLDDKPGWMSPAVEQELTEVVSDHIGADPMDADGLRRAVAAYAEQPWVREVRQVRRGADGRIHVEADYRRPIAVLRTPDGYVLVDEDAVRLPGLYARHQVPLLGLIEITGVARATPRVGERWRGDDLAAGLTLAAMLDAEPFVDQIDALDVSGRDDRGRITLALYSGRRRIIWGFPIGHPQPIEPDATVKLTRLRALAEGPGGLAGSALTALLNSPGGTGLRSGTLEQAEARHGFTPTP